MAYLCYCGMKFDSLAHVREHCKSSHSNGSLKYLMERVVNLDKKVDLSKRYVD
jgi:hypothetical protein